MKLGSKSLCIALCAWLMLPKCIFALGQPYKPINPDEILVILPKSFNNITTANQLTSNPISEIDAAIKIREYLSLASETGEDRYLGYARALRKQFSQQASTTGTTVEFQLAEAALLQREHLFEPANEILKNIIRAHPNNTEAHLMAAYIAMSQGQAKRALPHCQQMGQKRAVILKVICTATAKSLLGEVDASYRQLQAIHQSLSLPPVEQRELQLSLAEMAAMKGDFNSAEQYFLQTLQQAPNDLFVKVRLFDTYIAATDYKKASAFYQATMSQEDEHPLLLLRIAIANLKSDGQLAPSLQSKISNYFGVLKLRKPNLVSRDYAEYLLYIENSPTQAVQVSLENWRTQREPADTNLVLRAAIAANSPGQVLAVTKWIRESGLKDHYIDSLLSKLEAI